MKYLISILALVAVTFTVNAQTSPVFYSEAATPDTAINTTAVTFTFDKAFYGKGSLECYVQADSISGSTAGTIYYEIAYEPTGSTEWYPISTDTYNGVESHNGYEDTDFNAVRFRVRVVGTGTQSTIMRPYIVFKRNY